MEEKAQTQKLTGFIKISIAILAIITLASISLLFIGDFEGKFERVFSTLTLFVIFVLLTAFDTRKGFSNEWYAPVALIANSYILGLLLIVIWVTPYDPYELMFAILWKSIFVILTTRLVTFGLELLLKIGRGNPAPLGIWGQITSILGVLSLILFTAPTGIETFKVTIPEIYWKIAVATLIITGLGITITLLLKWYYSSNGGVPTTRAVYGYSAHYSQPHYSPQVGAPTEGQAPFQPIPASDADTEVGTDVAPETHAPEAAETNQAPAQPVEPAPQAHQPAPQAPAQQPAPLLPWPTFPNGQPLPSLPNGQPDFSALNRGW